MPGFDRARPRAARWRPGRGPDPYAPDCGGPVTRRPRGPRRMLALPCLLLALGLVMASGGIGYAGPRTPGAGRSAGAAPDTVEGAAHSSDPVGRLLGSLLPRLGLTGHQHGHGVPGTPSHRAPHRPSPPAPPQRPTPPQPPAAPHRPAAPTPKHRAVPPHGTPKPTDRATAVARPAGPATRPAPKPPAHQGTGNGTGNDTGGTGRTGIDVTVHCPFGLLRVPVLGLTRDVCEIQVRTAACAPLLVIDFWGNRVVVADPRERAELRRLLGIAARRCHRKPPPPSKPTPTPTPTPSPSPTPTPTPAPSTPAPPPAAQTPAPPRPALAPPPPAPSPTPRPKPSRTPLVSRMVRQTPSRTPAGISTIGTVLLILLPAVGAAVLAGARALSRSR